MAKMGRPGLSDVEKAELWRLWGSGNSISEIAQKIDRAPGSIFTVLCSNGGYVPPDRVRRAGCLTFEEREEISRGLAAKQTFAAIAETLGRSTSTVSREVNGNGGRDAYRAAEADQQKRRLTSADRLSEHHRGFTPSPLMDGILEVHPSDTPQSPRSRTCDLISSDTTSPGRGVQNALTGAYAKRVGGASLTQSTRAPWSAELIVA